MARKKQGIYQRNLLNSNNSTTLYFLVKHCVAKAYFRVEGPRFGDVLSTEDTHGVADSQLEGLFSVPS